MFLNTSLKCKQIEWREVSENISLLLVLVALAPSISQFLAVVVLVSRVTAAVVLKSRVTAAAVLASRVTAAILRSRFAAADTAVLISGYSV